MRSRAAGTQGLVFGGIMAALIVVFSIVPILGLFMPIPLVLVYVRYGGRIAALTAAVSLVFSGMLGGVVEAVLLIPAGILPGLVFGYGFFHRRKLIMIGLVAIVAFFLGFVLQYSIARVVMFDGRDPLAAMVETEPVRKQIDFFLSAYERLTQPAANATSEQRAMAAVQLAWIQEFRQNPAAVAWVLLPSTLFFIGSITTWVNYMLCRLVMPRFGHSVPRTAPFSEFYLPTWLVWSFALIMLVSSYVGVSPSLVNAPWGVRVLLNLFVPLSYIFVLAGIAVVYGFLRKRNLTKAPAVVLSLVGFFLGALGVQLYIFAAIWDTMFDFRGLGHGLMKRSANTP